ncbi:MAG: hypothetical protein RI918_1238, partial [Pseudomonadota bacterium]
MSDATPRIELPAGWIEGVYGATGASPSVLPLRIFKGIPYASPTDGDKRWLAPQPVTPWTGVRLCDQFGATAVQANLLGIPGYAGDFDCLNLNVWCPQGDGPWPVMVWIPGGGFMRGGTSDALYDGGAIASAGVVFVSINYRVGVDGFMHFEDAAPNRGLQDQLAALKWVQKNIAAFGGDPKKITLAGESAGSIAVSMQMSSPMSRGRIAGAIGESGAGITPTMAPMPLADAEKMGVDFLKKAGVQSIKAFRAMATREVYEIFDESKLFGFPIVIDGYFLPKTIPQIFAAKEQAQVPLLLGWNS